MNGMTESRIVQHIVNQFLPTMHNGFIPRLLKDRAVWAVLGVTTALFSFSQLLHVTNYLNINAEIYPTTVLTLTNQDRAAAGVPALSASQELQTAAEEKLQDMIDNNYFAHTSPGGLTPWYWFEKAGYSFLYAGENLASNFTDSGDVENAWLASPLHRANILNGAFTEIGIATAQKVSEGRTITYVVELFGTPAVMKNSARVVIPIKTVHHIAQVGTSPTVAGASVATSNKSLNIIDQSESFVSVQNTDDTLEQRAVTEPVVPRVSWFSRFLLAFDTYAGTMIEVVIVALIMAMGALVTREYERHHRRHMVYGILLTVVLTSFLFVGRIGVFAETHSQFSYTLTQ